MVTKDGTDFYIIGASPFYSGWYSHKFKVAGIRYEEAVSINGGDIVWTNGLFCTGNWPDISLTMVRGLKQIAAIVGNSTA